MSKDGRTMNLADWATLVALATLWGGSFFFIAIALRGFSPLTLVFARTAIGAVLLWGVAAALGKAMPRDLATWRSLLVQALLNNVVPLTLFSWGQTQISGGLAAILNATTPVWGVLIAHVVIAGERLTVARVAALLLGFTGVAITIGGDAVRGLGANVLPQLACLIGAACYSFASVLGRNFSERGVDPIVTAAGSLAMAALVTLPAMLFIDRPWGLPAPPLTAWGAVAALGVLSSALGFLLYYRLLANAGPTNVMLVTFLIPITPILLGWLVLGEHLAPQHFLGLAVIALGLVAVDGRLPRFAWEVLRRPIPAP
ncbi:DMT family transporter [Sphingomonas sp. LB-2]|uniref:DMT family transporter n=1 Tax=Sphingomonas caeni TaxID=2984949 RepID=UPI0022318944|nr:DMT family transporter [Sphingomonas caeni]MCW3845699.1 DMT family transporter [Sphingomonas caeni]